MGRRKFGEENVRKIQKIRRSYYIALPIQLVREFGWDVGEEIIVEKFPARGAPVILLSPAGFDPSKLRDGGKTLRIEFRKLRVKK